MLLLALAPAATAAAQAPSSAGNGPLGAGSADGQYTLGPGDRLRIIVFGEENLTGEFAVSGSGDVAFPLIGAVPAAGRSVADLEAAIRTRLADGYLRDPRVAAEVLTYRPFFILGEVNKPGEYAYRNGLTIMNAVATAGGFTYRANQRKVLVRRAGTEKEREITVDASTPIAPGDTIRVRERFF
ncbi:polysaccharide export protein [Phenylobacterium sp. J426]|uniref:polysaccharide biosynthesis/export family protein n=1 Tax=Phenylobacterium sp. J426 TaxID=2898439 RepID=UPI002150DD49|nr:polysaccharide biosynthesis/export family protein [Phenylobacterium sp. J426]MCR5876530.1 polysaccharide export protein [Phenylobacterium sp. J426]